MSCQRGNVKRTRPQKYQNSSAFRNNLNDSSKKTKEINKLEVAEVCKQCKDVIEWKIKYKKYKPLTQPKTCANCHQKSIKHAYHALCDPCGKLLEVCCKCRQSKKVLHKAVQLKPKEDVLAMMKRDLKVLPERKRRAFYRYVDTFYDKKKRLKALKSNEDSDEEAEEVDEEKASLDDEMEKKLDDEKSATLDDDDYCENYLEKIRLKLEELGKGIFIDDGFGDEEESDDETDNLT